MENSNGNADIGGTPPKDDGLEMETGKRDDATSPRAGIDTVELSPTVDSEMKKDMEGTAVPSSNDDPAEGGDTKSLSSKGTADTPRGKNGGGKEGLVEKTPQQRKSKRLVDRGRPPLPKRSLPPPPPPARNRRQRSHSMDNSELAALGASDINSDGIAADAMDLVPSSASAGVLEGSDRLDRLEADGIISTDLFDALSNPNLDDDTPAAAALRANANVRVSNVSKFARRIKAQNIRRFVKRAALIGKSGHVRGKPPRAPPFRGADNDIVGGSLPNIYALEEEDGGIVYMDSSIDSENEEPSGAAKRGSEHISSAPAGIIQQRSTSQPVLPAKNLKASVGFDVDIDAPAVVEKDNAAPTRVGTQVHSTTPDGIPTEVHTTPEGAGRTKLQIAPHFIAWKRRKAKKKKDHRKSYVKGKVIDGQHELYTLSIAVMLGLRTSIGMTNKQMSDSTGSRRYLQSEDFKHTEKYVFRPKGGAKTPPHQLSHTFKFKDYSPLVFAYMRRMFGINEFDFLLSVCGNANFIEFISNAKSGQFFFYSYDGKYMIKTMTNAESKFLRRILPRYFRHCAQNPNTLITKFLGMYRVKLYHLRRNVKFVIMNSVFDTDKVIKSLFDLKGSITGRDAKPDQDVKKDNDFRKGRPDSVMALHPEVRSRVREQIVRDCEFFKKMKIMDYSMLVGVHYIPPKPKYNGEAGRSSFRESLRDTPGSSTRKRASQRYLQSEDAKGTSKNSTEKAMLSDKALHAIGKEQENSRRVSGASTPVQKPKSHTRKPSLTPGQSGMSIGSDLGIFGEAANMSSLNTLDYFFDDDDDNSYLDFANVNPAKTVPDAVMASATAPYHYHVSKDTNPAACPPPIGFPFPGCNNEGSITMRLDDIEHKKELTTQQMFWPFHRFFDIHGRRRMVPPQGVDSSSGDQKILDQCEVAPFVPPLSRRKDGGLMMDVGTANTPFKVKLPSGSVLMCEGKIFYIGIIDILQRFNSRKRCEAVLRRYQGSGWQDASCVHPDLYADRFVAFFDECTQRDPSLSKTKGASSVSSAEAKAEGKVTNDAKGVRSAETKSAEEEKEEIQMPNTPVDVKTPK